ncbi:tetratricopeptide repeat protein [Dactylosporangium vinaceum]|uniref:Tetratricopeptide repeat protein n=1 Tax=Dactylosporangium vinaceum TaxID=53362 RepID=A0ABV5M9Z6_9ACTN|nr:tetratricopeptide repeat protein [Dactylosporangium vinaceum]UAB93123.1 tetratricopeptide repeat protein [Dactylosporangium vinaceum]
MTPADRSANAVRDDQRAVRATLQAPLGRLASQQSLHGRSDLIERLWAAVLDTGGDRVHLLHGLSGSGKTAVALTVAGRADAAGLDVWWVRADDALTLQEHMRALGKEVGVSETDSPHSLWKALNARRDDRWLLVIDNADDHEVLAAGTGRLADGCGWVQPCRSGHGTVLVLSRYLDEQAPVGWWRAHPVGRLDRAAGIETLADHVEVDTELDAAGQLVDRLGGLPLALRLAGALLHQARRQALAERRPPPTIADYLADIGARLRLEDPPDSPGVRVYIDRPWSVAIEFLERHAPPLTVPLLRLLAHLGPGPVPVGDILSPAALDRIGLHGEQLLDALDALKAMSLVDDDCRPALHPLVRDTTARRFPPSAADAADLVSLVRHCRTLSDRPDDTPTPEDVNVWPDWLLLTPHAMRVVDLLLDEWPGQPAGVVRDACYAADYVVRSIQARGLYDTADAALARIEALAVRDLGPDDFETLRCRHIRAIVLHARGQIAEAYAAYDEIYRARERLFGADNPETVRSRHYRAMTLHTLGRHDEARAEYEAVLADRVRIAGPDQRHTLATEHNIARLLHDTGRLGEAEVRYRDLLARQSRLMGPDYRHTLATRHNLALCLHAQGRLEAAEHEYRQVLDIELELLGPRHPETLLTRANLLLLQSACGRGDEAALDEVYRQQCEVLGREHHETRATRSRQTNRGTRPGPL